MILRTILVGPKRLQIISTSAVSFEPNRDLPNSPELLILQNRKGQSVDALCPPARDGSLRASLPVEVVETFPDGDSPPVKGSRPIYPMETPNGAANTVGGRFYSIGLAF